MLTIVYEYDLDEQKLHSLISNPTEKNMKILQGYFEQLCRYIDLISVLDVPNDELRDIRYNLERYLRFEIGVDLLKADEIFNALYGKSIEKRKPEADWSVMSAWMKVYCRIVGNYLSSVPDSLLQDKFEKYCDIIRRRKNQIRTL